MRGRLDRIKEAEKAAKPLWQQSQQVAFGLAKKRKALEASEGRLQALQEERNELDRRILSEQEIEAKLKVEISAMGQELAASRATDAAQAAGWGSLEQ
eukprot:8160359-Alexandrium_andersonii.AAC.1